jgi:hypothetical protein
VVCCIPRKSAGDGKPWMWAFLESMENSVAEKEALDVGMAVVRWLDERFHL